MAHCTLKTLSGLSSKYKIFVEHIRFCLGSWGLYKEAETWNREANNSTNKK